MAYLRAKWAASTTYYAEMEALMARKDSAMNMLACMRLGCSG